MRFLTKMASFFMTSDWNYIQMMFDKAEVGNGEGEIHYWFLPEYGSGFHPPWIVPWLAFLLSCCYTHAHKACNLLYHKCVAERYS